MHLTADPLKNTEVIRKFVNSLRYYFWPSDKLTACDVKFGEEKDNYFLTLNMTQGMWNGIFQFYKKDDSNLGCNITSRRDGEQIDLTPRHHKFIQDQVKYKFGMKCHCCNL